jgi:CheY-like chemotaxis protein
MSVSDDGIGIAADELSRIFEMFSQVDSESNRSDGGLGIGLSLVKGLIELHGGDIEARSDGPGRGSEFVVRIPLNAGVTVPPRHPEVCAAPVKQRTRRIMIADDNKDAADALGMLLELAGHDVRMVYNGRSALTLARTFRPDVAFIDIGMPDMTGYEVAQQLRRKPLGSGPFLVALTGWGQDDDRRRAREAGFDRHMTKPVDSEEVDGLIAAATSFEE